jgi:hypothetical protein
MYSYVCHILHECDQIHALTTLLLGKEPPITHQGLGWLGPTADLKALEKIQTLAPFRKWIMIVFGYPATDLINILNALFTMTENRHPAAPEDDNNYQGYVCVYSQILFSHITMATFLQFPISSPQFTGHEHTKYLYRQSFKSYMAVRCVSLRKNHKTFYCSFSRRLRPQ